MSANLIPDGFMQNAAGHLVPVETISPVDIQRHELVMEIVTKAAELNNALAAFKE